jgi:hypothetical protein
MAGVRSMNDTADRAANLVNFSIISIGFPSGVTRQGGEFTAVVGHWRPNPARICRLKSLLLPKTFVTRADNGRKEGQLQGGIWNIYAL